MLKRIEVTNFKSLKHIDFKCAGLNLLMGLNGAGKSSFVQLLEVMRVMSRRGLKSSDTIAVSEVADKGKFEDFRYCYASSDAGIGLNVEFGWRKVMEWVGGQRFILSRSTFDHLKDENAPEGDDIQRISRCICDDGRGGMFAFHPLMRDKVMCSDEWCQYRKFVQDNGGTKRIEHMEPNDAVRGQYTLLKHKFIDLKESVVKEVEKQEAQAKLELSDLWHHAQKIDAFRGKPECVHKVGLIDSRKCEDGDGRFDSEGEDAVEFLDKFGKEIVLYQGNPMRRCGGTHAESYLMDEVNSWMSVVSPGVSIDIERVLCGDEEMLVENIGFGEGDEKRSFKPQNVGFGISYTLPVVVALLTAQPEDIIIIENPEAHLHPKGQAQMGELIARAAKWGVQLFVETHSDHVVNGIRSAVKDGIVKPSDVNIAYFERKEHDVPNADGTAHQEIYSEVRNIRVDKNGSLSEYPDGFLDEWNNQLMELI